MNQQRQHRTRFWWACPVCLEARTHDTDEYVREWAIRQLRWLREGIKEKP